MVYSRFLAYNIFCEIVGKEHVPDGKIETCVLHDPYYTYSKDNIENLSSVYKGYTKEEYYSKININMGKLIPCMIVILDKQPGDVWTVTGIHINKHDNVIDCMQFLEQYKCTDPDGELYIAIDKSVINNIDKKEDIPMNKQSTFNAYCEIFGVDKRPPKTSTKYSIYSNPNPEKTFGEYILSHGHPKKELKIYDKFGIIERVLSRNKVETGTIVVINPGNEFFILNTSPDDVPAAVVRFINRFQTVYFIREVTSEEKEEVLEKEKTTKELQTWGLGG